MDEGDLLNNPPRREEGGGASVADCRRSLGTQNTERTCMTLNITGKTQPSINIRHGRGCMSGRDEGDGAGKQVKYSGQQNNVAPGILEISEEETEKGPLLLEK